MIKEEQKLEEKNEILKERHLETKNNNKKIKRVILKITRIRRP